MNRSQIQNLAQQLMAEHNLIATGWTFKWDNGRRRAGACHYGPRVLSFSFAILGKATDEDIRDTILHEIAHALTPGHHHDNVWRAKHVQIGGSGRRNHTMETPKGRYELVCAKCGVIGHRHQKTGTLKYATETGAHSATPYVYHPKCGGGVWLRDTKTVAPKPVVTLPVSTPTSVKIPVAAANPTPNPALVCTCGCNGTTKGGAYLPGHDARHVSQVFQDWIANRYDLDGALHVLRHAPKLQAKLQARIAAYAEKHYK